jgi:hypothetical protein
LRARRFVPETRCRIRDAGGFFRGTTTLAAASLFPLPPSRRCCRGITEERNPFVALAKSWFAEKLSVIWALLEFQRTIPRHSFNSREGQTFPAGAKEPASRSPRHSADSRYRGAYGSPMIQSLKQAHPMGRQFGVFMVAVAQSNSPACQVNDALTPSLLWRPLLPCRLQATIRGGR